MRSIASALAVLLLTSLAALADPVGRYDVIGKNPNGTEYYGTATVARSGQTYSVVWVIGSTSFYGTAVGADKLFAVSYRAGDKTGIALYIASGRNWEGVWTFTGGHEVGTETWARR